MAGFAAASVLAFALTQRLRLSAAVTGTLVAAALLGFWALAVATKFVRGRESLTYYHHEALVLAVSAVLLVLLRRPRLPYLDVMLLSVGLFFVLGRLACLAAGCCHGRPGRWGVRYGEEHVRSGFPRCLVGVRLVPVQAMEAAWVLCTVAGGVRLLLGGAPPGAALAWYTVVYGIGRFGFEFLRGDACRPYFGPFSEAQWTSFAFVSVVAWAELSGALPLAGGHIAAAVALAVAMAVLAVFPRENARLFRARHLREIAELLEAARARSEGGGDVVIGETSLGLRISASGAPEGAGGGELFALSSGGWALSEGTARRLARLIARLRRGTEAELTPGRNGVFHVLLPRSENGL